MGGLRSSQGIKAEREKSRGYIREGSWGGWLLGNLREFAVNLITKQRRSVNKPCVHVSSLVFCNVLEATPRCRDSYERCRDPRTLQ